jgi:hypothetical protein
VQLKICTLGRAKRPEGSYGMPMPLRRARRHRALAVSRRKSGQGSIVWRLGDNDHTLLRTTALLRALSQNEGLSSGHGPAPDSCQSPRRQKPRRPCIIDVPAKKWHDLPLGIEFFDLRGIE